MLLVVIPVLLVLNLLSAALIKNTPHYYQAPIILTCIAMVLVVIWIARAVMWLVVGKRYQLSYIYPLLGLNYLLAFIVGIIFFDESFSWRRLVGVVIIFAGVYLVSQSPHQVNETRAPEVG